MNARAKLLEGARLGGASVKWMKPSFSITSERVSNSDRSALCHHTARGEWKDDWRPEAELIIQRRAARFHVMQSRRFAAAIVISIPSECAGAALADFISTGAHAKWTRPDAAVALPPSIYHPSIHRATLRLDCLTLKLGWVSGWWCYSLSSRSLSHGGCERVSERSHALPTTRTNSSRGPTPSVKLWCFCREKKRFTLMRNETIITAAGITLIESMGGLRSAIEFLFCL